jgi:hypothetical protein
MNGVAGAEPKARVWACVGELLCVCVAACPSPLCLLFYSDLEPQADNCQGAGSGDASDAVLFAKWLSAVRAVLNPAGVRLTVDVAR